MKRVLIVEDDMAIADNLSQIVELLGYEALSVAQNYEQAIAKLDESVPDLVTLDIDLKSEKTGIDVAHYIRSKGNTSFIFVTGQSDRATVESALATGATAYLQKPFSISEIKTALATVFDSAKQRAGDGNSVKLTNHMAL